MSYCDIQLDYHFVGVIPITSTKLRSPIKRPFAGLKDFDPINQDENNLILPCIN
jgi:hypothetical protein